MVRSIHRSRPTSEIEARSTLSGGDKKIKRPGLTEELHNVAGGEITEIEIKIKASER